ncbi:membrane-associated phospholipid phosphatase [Massilia sp. CCM 8734]|uniref:membrane-associated phospholipid phosphatase n=1 Tax=Massilia sp. CCM 8734 TaxID=2609283 RepID=UPI00142451C4|nr:membrane-associated phospholipid phosphatase [Massilia sp. CCM 8734]NHZ96264.1 membrane-associated phospholipid phosphatase [Massilia sp. CCM 8734]
MSELTFLLHLGDPRVTMPLGAALLAWMLAARAWRLALWWGLLLGAGLGLVAVSKIVFLGWGGGVPLLGYKALSGHAAGASAVFPMLFWMLALGRADGWRERALRLGLGVGALTGALLVADHQHSVAEALAGCLLGAAISLGSIRLGAAGVSALSLKGLLPATGALLAAAWLMKWAHLGYWMIRAARLLSGNTQVYPL